MRSFERSNYEGICFTKKYYEEYANSIVTLLNNLMSLNGITVHGIYSRVKDKNSLSNKINEKNKYNSILEITDIVGIRIITHFEGEVDIVAEVLNSEFYLDKEHSADKRNKDNPDVFGYASLHYILKLKEPRYSLAEYSNCKDVKFEVQIRSVLQHAWAEINHDLGYKNKKDVPVDIQRDFSRISGLLELADKEFIRIRKYMNDYNMDVDYKLGIKDYNMPIDQTTYFKYLKQSSINEEILRESINRFSKIGVYKKIEHKVFLSERFLSHFKFDSIATLDKLLKEHKQCIIEFIQYWDELGSVGSLGLDISVYALYYVLLSNEETEVIKQVLSPDYLEESLDYYVDKLKGFKKI